MVEVKKGTIVFFIVIMLGWYIFGIFFGFNIGLNSKTKADMNETYNQTETQENITTPTLLSCQKEVGLQDSMVCVNNYVNSVFIYKEIGNNKTTRTELITNGGDCENWAEFYMEVGRELGFDAKPFTFCVVNETREITMCHKVAFVFDWTGYCLLDQEDIDYFYFGEGTNESEAQK